MELGSVTLKINNQHTTHTQSSRSWFAKRPRPGEVVTWAASDSGSRNTGGGSGYAALLAHAEGVLYGMELGSVTSKINNQHTLDREL